MRNTCARTFLSLLFLLAALQSANGQRMQTDRYEIPPFGFSHFCLLKPTRCTPSDAQIVRMNASRWRDLAAVNTSVNTGIVYESDGSTIRPWRDDTNRGDCKDYALSKRSRLIERGWPASALLIALAQVPSGEMHAVLIVVTDRGELVLDNRQHDTVSYRHLRYRWHKRMSPENPRLWRRIISWLRSNPESLLLLHLGLWRLWLRRPRAIAQCRDRAFVKSRPSRVTLAAAATSEAYAPSIRWSRAHSAPVKATSPRRPNGRP